MNDVQVEVHPMGNSKRSSIVRNLDGEGLIKTERIEKESLVDHQTNLSNRPNINLIETNIVNGLTATRI